MEFVRGMRHETSLKLKREKKRWRELMEKRRGITAFITRQRGRPGRWMAKPEGVDPYSFEVPRLRRYE